MDEETIEIKYDWDKWARRNWFLFIVVLVVIICTFVVMANTGEIVKKAVYQCNEYYQKELGNRMIGMTPYSSENYALIMNNTLAD